MAQTPKAPGKPRSEPSTITVGAPPPRPPRISAPIANWAGLDQASAQALRNLYSLALRPVLATTPEIEAINTMRLSPRVGQYKAEVLEWLRRQQA